MPLKQMMVRPGLLGWGTAALWEGMGGLLRVSPAVLTAPPWPLSPENSQQRPGPQLAGQAGVLRGAALRRCLHRAGAPGPLEGGPRGGHEDPGRCPGCVLMSSGAAQGRAGACGVEASAPTCPVCPRAQGRVRVSLLLSLAPDQRSVQRSICGVTGRVSSLPQAWFEWGGDGGE